MHCNFPLFFWWRETFCQQENTIPLRFLGQRSEAWISKKKWTLEEFWSNIMGWFDCNGNGRSALLFPRKEKPHSSDILEYGRRAVCWGVGWESFSIKCSFVWHYKQLYSHSWKKQKGLKKKKKTWSSVKENQILFIKFVRTDRLLFLLVMKMCSCEENQKKHLIFAEHFVIILPIELSSCVFFACNPGTHNGGYGVGSCEADSEWKEVFKFLNVKINSKSVPKQIIFGYWLYFLI